MKHATTSATYAMLSKWVKLQHEKKHELDLENIKSLALSRYQGNALRFLFHKNSFFIEKEIHC